MMGDRLPVYLDRDGVINANRADYVRSLSQWEPIQGSLEAVARLSSSGHPVIILTNQSAIARGYCTEDDVRKIHARMKQMVEECGGAITGMYYCPHHPDDGCSCRKPATGMIELARMEHGLGVGGWMVGDAASDMEMGLKAGLSTILVLTGRGTVQLEEIRKSGMPEPDYIAADLAEASLIILHPL